MAENERRFRVLRESSVKDADKRPIAVNRTHSLCKSHGARTVSVRAHEGTRKALRGADVCRERARRMALNESEALSRKGPGG